jgi:hypothetical protein
VQSLPALLRLDSAGTTKVAQTADLSTVFASSGEKVMALITPYVMAAAGYVKVLLWSVFGGTAPNLARAVQMNSVMAVAGQSAPNYRSSTADTGLTTTAQAAIGTQTASQSIPFVALL